MRKSWIQVIYGKDNIVPKVPKHLQNLGEKQQQKK